MTYPQDPGPAYGQPYGQQPPTVPGPPAQYSPQPHGAPPPGYGYAPQPPARRRRRWPWIVGGILAVMVLGCVGAFALLGAGASKISNNSSGKNAAKGAMGVPAVDGKFQFTLTAYHCGVPSVGPADLGEKAQGEFCLVNVTVKNVGKTVEVFDDNSQKAYDSSGVEFTADSGAGVWANKDYSTFLESINPGNQVKGVLVYDVPKGAKLASVVLHESFFTAGVKVPLS